MYFDVSKQWSILRPPSYAAVALMLERAIGAMREGRVPPGAPPVRARDCAGDRGTDYVILINGDESSQKMSYAWRAGADRVEIYGHRLESVENAVLDFLAALGVHAGRDGSCTLPPVAGCLYPLERSYASRLF